MIGFGLRLAVAGGREALTRLIVMASAVAVGAGLLLATLARINALNAQLTRYASMFPSASTGGDADPLWWSTRQDYFHGKQMFRKPADQLGDRYPGHDLGTIGQAALTSPDALLIIVGGTPDEVATLPQAIQLTSIGDNTPALPETVVDLIVGVIAGGLLFPVLIFIGTATRLSAGRREQRFAAMRLVGATPRQISVIAAVEATTATIAGTALPSRGDRMRRHPEGVRPVRRRRYRRRGTNGLHPPPRIGVVHEGLARRIGRAGRPPAVAGGLDRRRHGRFGRRAGALAHRPRVGLSDLLGGPARSRRVRVGLRRPAAWLETTGQRHYHRQPRDRRLQSRGQHGRRYHRAQAPFSLLRLSGAPVRILRRVVAIESAVPMLAVAVVAIGMGFLAAQLFLKAQMEYTLSAPGVGFYAIVVVGLAACLGIIASTLPLLERITGRETARSE